MMLVPSLAVAIFTSILKREGYEVDLFDTTHYVSGETSCSQNRVNYLQARHYDRVEGITNDGFTPPIMIEVDIVEGYCNLDLHGVDMLKAVHLRNKRVYHFIPVVIPGRRDSELNN